MHTQKANNTELISRIQKCDFDEERHEIITCDNHSPFICQAPKKSKGKGGHIFPLNSELGFQIPFPTMYSSRKGQNHKDHRTSELESTDFRVEALYFQSECAMMRFVNMV